MKFIDAKQIELDAINKDGIDVFICSLGYESRCTTLAKKMINFPCRKFAIAFDAFSDNRQRKQNNKFFAKSNYKIYNYVSNDDDSVINILSEIESCFDKKSLNILVDYSSMTSDQYSMILYHFINLTKFNQIELYFSYSYAKFIAPNQELVTNRQVKPVFGFSSLSLPAKPTALIIGLGYEKGKAFGLSEYLDAETYIFYTQPEEHNQEFSEEVEKQNQDTLTYFNSENIIQYPLYNLTITQNLLYKFCSDLQENYRVILAPCGPKPFTLLCLITALSIKDIDVWRISSSTNPHTYNRISNGKFSVMHCSFSN